MNERLATAMWDRGLTHAALAKKVKLSRVHVTRLVGGQRPGPATAKRIADYFEVTPSEFWPVAEKDEAA